MNYKRPKMVLPFLCRPFHRICQDAEFFKPSPLLAITLFQTDLDDGTNVSGMHYIWPIKCLRRKRKALINRMSVLNDPKLALFSFCGLLNSSVSEKEPFSVNPHLSRSHCITGHTSSILLTFHLKPCAFIQPSYVSQSFLVNIITHDNKWGCDNLTKVWSLLYEFSAC